MTSVMRPAVAEANALYQQRLETTFEIKPGHADRIEAAILEHIGLDTEFPGRQNVDTVYFRAVPREGKAKGEFKPPKDDFRIRIYPDTPESPAFLEFKDDVTVGDQVFKEKVRATVDYDTHLRIMNGERAADVIGTVGREGEPLTVAGRAIDLIDDVGLQPVMRGTYYRTTMTNVAPGAPEPAVPVRVTLDRGIRHTGIGQLAGVGSVERGVELLDVKVTGATPEWLSAIIKSETEAGVLQLAERGKGGTAVRQLAELVQPFRRLL